MRIAVEALLIEKRGEIDKITWGGQLVH